MSESTSKEISYRSHPPTYVTLEISYDTEHSDPCTFWLGVFKPGQVRPGDLLDAESIASGLEMVEDQGFDENIPIMIADTKHEASKFIYLSPLPKLENLSTWLKENELVLNNWKPEKVGLYFSKDVIENSFNAWQDFFVTTLQSLIENTDVRHFQIMLGRMGLNTLLNAVLKLKPLCSNLQKEVVILH